MCYPALLFLKTKPNPDLIKLQGEIANLTHRLKVSVCSPQALLHDGKLWQNKTTATLVSEKRMGSGSNNPILGHTFNDLKTLH